MRALTFIILLFTICVPLVPLGAIELDRLRVQRKEVFKFAEKPVVTVQGDEVAIMHCMNLGVHSDRRLFLCDVGNDCIRSVKLDYYASETVPLAGSGSSR